MHGLPEETSARQAYEEVTENPTMKIKVQPKLI